MVVDGESPPLLWQLQFICQIFGTCPKKENMREGKGKQTQRKREERERERETDVQINRVKAARQQGGSGNRKDGEACGEERSASGRQQFLVECWKTSRGT